MKLKVGYPSKAEEKQILERMGETTSRGLGQASGRVLTPAQIASSGPSSGRSTPTSA